MFQKGFDFAELAEFCCELDGAWVQRPSCASGDYAAAVVRKAC
jgi:hypothetical protein